MAKQVQRWKVPQKENALILPVRSEWFPLVSDKSEDDVERESQLLECRLTLTEERNAVLVPAAGSGIPGAPVQRCVSAPRPNVLLCGESVI